MMTVSVGMAKHPLSNLDNMRAPTGRCFDVNQGASGVMNPRRRAEYPRTGIVLAICAAIRGTAQMDDYESC